MRLNLVITFLLGALFVLFVTVNPAVVFDIDHGSASNSRQTIGKILEVRGDGLSKAPYQDFFHEAGQGDKIFPLQKLLTGFDSQILVDLGEKFWLMPNSQIKVESIEGANQVHLLSGAIKRFEQQNNSQVSTAFFVEGQQKRDMEIGRAGKPELSQIPIEDVALEVEDRKQQNIPVSISEQEIHETFSLQRRFIEKCFIGHYTKRTGQTQSGKVWIRFIVSGSGELTDPIVTRSDFNDEEFHKCLKDVVARVSLKSYSGPPVKVEFPISIELPE